MITKVKIQNFKAISKMVEIPMQPFTAFIGNNGSGKSTVIEALQLLQDCCYSGTDAAFQKWGGLERVRNYNARLAEPEISEAGFHKDFSPIIIGIEWETTGGVWAYEVHFNLSRSQDYYLIEYEEIRHGSDRVAYSHLIGDTEKRTLETLIDGVHNVMAKTYTAKATFFEHVLDVIWNSEGFEPFELWYLLRDLQFLSLNPHDMGKPIVQSRTSKDIHLAPDGRNIAEYLLWLRSQGQEHLDRLIELMQFVLPFVSDVQPSVTQGFNREVELAMLESAEQARPLPGWLLSGGTLRVLAILSQFVLPKKPPVLFIDEIENGLDPRTIGLILSLIQQEYHAKGMQVIVTSHSPYFLDLCELQSIVVCEKDERGCTFSIPADDAKLKVWKEKFSPGQLYTMGKLTK